jgi:2-polyprenyl-3-methyl-5-hydroxy-6-metoxy-1,4-benzoquinol methylase
MIPSLRQRYLVPELMDAPNLDPVAHAQALAGLRRVNWLCNTSKHISKTILEIVNKRNLSSVDVLDLGCGSGDIAIGVQSLVSKRVPCQLAGWDISEVAVLNAREHTKGAEQPKFDVTNALSETQPNRKFDFVYCCLFLHHFDENESIHILKTMSELARVALIVDDLKRSRWGWLMAKVGCHLLSRSPIVHFDGPQSVRAAYTINEALSLANRAGLNNCQVKSHWPERYQLIWEKGNS